MVGVKCLRNGIVLGIVNLLIITSIAPNISSNFFEANIENNDLISQTISSIINNSILDLQLIYNITENLSYIIFTEYNESAGDIAKGRAFGSKGEHKAAEILYENMTKLGLYTWYESIENIQEYPYVAGKVDINERSLAIIDKNSHIVTPVKDFFISQRTNYTDLHILLETLKGMNPILGSIVAKLITTLILPINGSLDKKYNIYSLERLTHNFSYKSLKVIKKPSNYSLAMDLIRGIKNDDPFVYICKDLAFTEWHSDGIKFRGFLYKIILKILSNEGYSEFVIWSVFHPNCKGIIQIDSNNETYNMGERSAPVPIITVNRTIGEKIYENPESYNIDFYLNQSWNESVESYNVIGQLNGTNPEETIVVCSLYDSWWCQGTGDAAIGMAMVLAIAKYFKDNNITPKCNLKFIAFGGEEYGLRGALHYEAKHREENIPYVIDLNQLGFTPLKSENLKFQIWVNDQTLNSTIKEIADETEYTKRTGTDFQTRYKSDGGPSNAYSFSIASNQGKRSCKTLLFLKTGLDVPGTNWLNHHRDGMNHNEGDVIKYFNWTDTSVTGEMVWNVTKYLTVDNTPDLFSD